MKNLYRLMLLALIVVATAATAWGRQNDSLKGRCVNSKNEPVGYATVVVMTDQRQVAGTTTDEKGAFALSLVAGEYRLVVEFVGYKPIDRMVKVSGTTDLGTLTMQEETTEIGEVVVSAQMIRREADRYVVDVANSDSAIGKDGEELLRQSPGVWIQDDKISVNGASGTKLYVNEREMKLSGTDLLTYIRSLKAEDIAKIEIVPQTGAEHDADSSGGAIKITLRRRLDNGVMGTVGIYSGLGKYGHDPYPYANINANVGKFTLGGSISYYRSKHQFFADEQTDTLDGVEMCIVPRECSVEELHLLTDEAQRTQTTLCILAPRDERARNRQCRRLVSEHHGTSVDNRGYLLLFNVEGLPKQHFSL